ncbi:MAG: phenylalanine--tRNA ligase subunit beta, partial [Kiritimatiellales bacterium]
MKFALSWLKEYVDFDDTVAGLSDKLTFAGLEVENIETLGGTFEGVVVGEVKQIEPHPDADKLRLCTVEYGEAETLRVVCGAPNVAVGGKYPFATVGTTLPCGIKLKKAKIRGVESLGMLCAKDELGLGEDHSGLLVLDASLKPGTPLAAVMGPAETVFELEITPNRPDCLSIIGIAREVAAIYGKPLKMPSIELKESSEPVEKEVSVEVKDSGKCPRYTARVLKGVQIAPSPDWMKRRLEACGIRSINNVVDITNYVLLETGHPLHAFDYTLLKDGKIIVRHAAKGEKFTTLDGTERQLTEEMLVIADAGKSIALAGVMGGANTEIKDDTSTVLIEAA